MRWIERRDSVVGNVVRRVSGIEVGCGVAFVACLEPGCEEEDCEEGEEEEEKSRSMSTRGLGPLAGRVRFGCARVRAGD